MLFKLKNDELAKLYVYLNEEKVIEIRITDWKSIGIKPELQMKNQRLMPNSFVSFILSSTNLPPKVIGIIIFLS